MGVSGDCVPLKVPSSISFWLFHLPVAATETGGDCKAPDPASVVPLPPPCPLRYCDTISDCLFPDWLRLRMGGCVPFCIVVTISSKKKHGKMGDILAHSLSKSIGHRGHNSGLNRVSKVNSNAFVLSFACFLGNWLLLKQVRMFL